MMNHATKNMLVGALLMTAAVTVTVPEVDAGSCANVEDDGGFGGTTVECDDTLGCGTANSLFVSVNAVDKDAAVAGSYNCGNSAAVCSSPTPFCAGTSYELTEKSGEGRCKGQSDEFWSSPVAIACVSTGYNGGDGTEPIDIICKFQPDYRYCRDHAVEDQIERIRNVCERVPGFLSGTNAQEQGLLFSTLLGLPDLTSFQSVLYRPDGSGYIIKGDVHFGEFRCQGTETFY